MSKAPERIWLSEEELGYHDIPPGLWPKVMNPESAVEYIRADLSAPPEDVYYLLYDFFSEDRTQWEEDHYYIVKHWLDSLPQGGR